MNQMGASDIIPSLVWQLQDWLYQGSANTFFKAKCDSLPGFWMQFYQVQPEFGGYCL